MTLVAIDFEFNQTQEKHVNLVCVAFQSDEQEESIGIWLEGNEENKTKLKNFILSIKEEAVFVAYSVEAEARCFLALGVDPITCKWIDLYLEYRMMLNHNHRLAYGHQYKSGKLIFTKPPVNKYEATEQQLKKDRHDKPEYSLAAASYKLLDEKIDTDLKDLIRNRILKGAPFSPEEKSKILNYCKGDISDLFSMKEALEDEFYILTKDFKKYRYCYEEEALLRGEFAARTALMVSTGYPVNVGQVERFTLAVPLMLDEMKKDINGKLTLDLGFPPFKWHPKKGFSMQEKLIREYIETLNIKGWLLTDKKALSLSKDAFEKQTSSSHDYEDTLIDQMLRYKKFLQSLNGFMPGGKGKKFKEFIGSDGFVRANFGQYGAQSARSQPGASGYIFLKAAWMRSLIKPPKGYAITAIDYSSEEFLLSGLLSKDKKMIAAYGSGDPYFYFAKLAGAVPWNGVRKDHEQTRNIFKTVCLAEGSMIRVKDKGYVPIEQITSKDLIWDGIEWVSCSGSKYMGIKQVHEVEGVKVTPNHKILTANGWEESGNSKKEKRKRKVYYKKAERLSRASGSWSEVWRLGCSIFVCFIKTIWGAAKAFYISKR